MGKKIAAVMFATLFIISTFMMLRELNDRRKAAEQKNLFVTEYETDSTKGSETGTPVTRAPKTETEPEEIEHRIREYQRTDHNLYGWIEIRDTPINYPVMQGATAEYWLSHTPDRESNSHGSIYREEYSTENTIYLSGHSMKDGTMFVYINKHLSDFCGKGVFFTTEQGAIKAKVIKTVTAAADDAELIRSIEEDSFQRYAGVEDIRTIVLMCCEYSHHDGRLFVICQ